MSDAMTQALDFFMRWPTQIDRSASETETRAAAVTSLAALLTETRTKALEEAAKVCKDESFRLADIKCATREEQRRINMATETAIVLSHAIRAKAEGGEI